LEGLERSNVPGMVVPRAGLYGRAPKAMSSPRKRPNTHETPSHIEAAIAIQAYSSSGRPDGVNRVGAQAEAILPTAGD
jgi:hypothetical protein